MKVWTLAALTSLVLILPATVRAHHTQVTFYFMDVMVEVTGVVKRWALVNPHPELVLEVTEESGETKEMRIYALGAAGQGQPLRYLAKLPTAVTQSPKPIFFPSAFGLGA